MLNLFSQPACHTPHDTWDYDGTNETVMTDITYQGNSYKAIVSASRNGWFYAIDRTNGKLIHMEQFTHATSIAGQKDGKPYTDDDMPPTPDKEVFTCPSFLGGKSNGDDAYSEKNFHKLASSRCQLVLGFPIDVQAPLLPAGVKSTSAYGQTGFALVTRDHPPPPLAQLAAGTEVAVAYETAPNLFFENNPNIQADVHPDNQGSLTALVKGEAKAAMIWQPVVVHIRRSTRKGASCFMRS